MFFVTGLIPLLIGFLYYNPKTFGTIWMKTNGFTEESMKGANMGLIFGLTYLFSVVLSFFFTSVVIHQGGVFSMLMPDVMVSGSSDQQVYNELMVDYGDRFRTFGHGVIHGIMASVFFVLPIIAIISLFERRGWKYIMIHFGFWLICLMLIGGVLCQTINYGALS